MPATTADVSTQPLPFTWTNFAKRLKSESVSDGDILAFCREMDASKKWRSIVPGADQELVLDVKRRDGGRLINVHGALLVRPSESANAALPFVTVPFVLKKGHEVEVKHQEQTWTWSFDGVIRGDHCVESANWRVLDSTKSTRALVRFHVADHDSKLAQSRRPQSPNGRSSSATPPPTYRASSPQPPDAARVEASFGIFSSRRRRLRETNSPIDVRPLEDREPTSQPAPKEPRSTEAETRRSAGAYRPNHTAGLPAYKSVPVARRAVAPRLVPEEARRLERAVYDLLLHLGSPQLSSFRGQYPLEPRFSIPAVHEMIADGSGDRETCLETVVHMDGIWQSGQMDSQRGPLFGASRVDIPFFGLPGANLAPSNHRPIEIPGQAIRWQLNSRTGRKVLKGVRAGASELVRTTWTAVLSPRDGREPLPPLVNRWIVHFVEKGRYDPVPRRHLDQEIRAFSPGHRTLRPVARSASASTFSY